MGEGKPITSSTPETASTPIDMDTHQGGAASTYGANTNLDPALQGGPATAADQAALFVQRGDLSLDPLDLLADLFGLLVQLVGRLLQRVEARLEQAGLAVDHGANVGAVLGEGRQLGREGDLAQVGALGLQPAAA